MSVKGITSPWENFGYIEKSCWVPLETYKNLRKQAGAGLSCAKVKFKSDKDGHGNLR